jgi:hypothetical protein
MDGWTEECTYVNMEPRSEERGTTGSWTLQIRSTTASRSAQLVAGVESTAERSGSGNIRSRDEILRTGRWLNPKVWAREIMEKLRAAPHSEPLTDTWTSDFLSREGEGREVVGERLRDKTVPCQVQRRLMQAMTNSFPCGAHLHRMGLRRSNEYTHRMGLRRSNEYTLCQRAWKQREDDQHEGCGRSDPETLVHIQSARCALQARADTSVYHHCWQQVQREIIVVAASPESKGWTFLTLEGEQSMQTFGKKTCRELYRRTTLTETQTRETTDQVLDEAMWEEARPWEEKWESLKVNESKMTEQELDDEDRQARFWRRRRVRSQ